MSEFQALKLSDSPAKKQIFSGNGTLITKKSFSERTVEGALPTASFGMPTATRLLNAPQAHGSPRSPTGEMLGVLGFGKSFSDTQIRKQ